MKAESRKAESRGHGAKSRGHRAKSIGYKYWTIGRMDGWVMHELKIELMQRKM